MARVPLTNLGSIGIVTDLAEYELPPEALTACYNLRLRAGSVMKDFGEEIVLGTPSVDPFFIMPWEDGTSIYYIYGDGASLYRTDGITHTDVTRASGAYTAGSSPEWHGAVLEGLPYCNNTVDDPQGWDTGTSKFVDLPNWPAGTTCGVLRAFKGVMFAGDLTESGINYPGRVMWSQPAAAGAFPTSWDYTDDTKLTGVYNIGDTPGKVVDFVELGDALIAYKEDSTWIIRLVGGQYIFSSTKALRRFGAISTDCALEISKKHFVVTRGDVIVHQGATAESIIDGRIRKQLFASIDSEYKSKIKLLPNYRQNEIWVCVPEAGTDGRLSLAWVFNYKYHTWTSRFIRKISGGCSALIAPSGTVVYMDDLSGTMDAQSGKMDSDYTSEAVESLILCKIGATKKFLQVDNTYLYNGESYVGYIERVNLPISGIDRRKEVILDPTTVKYLRSVYPRISGQNGDTVNFYFGVQHSLEEGVNWGPALPFTIGTDTKVDVEISGNFLSYRVEFTGDNPVIFNGMDLDLEIVGEL